EDALQSAGYPPITSILVYKLYIFQFCLYSALIDLIAVIIPFQSSSSEFLVSPYPSFLSGRLSSQNPRQHSLSTDTLHSPSPSARQSFLPGNPAFRRSVKRRDRVRDGNIPNYSQQPYQHSAGSTLSSPSSHQQAPSRSSHP